jgi:RNA polymerase sigma-70 factor (ECF subfamily)
MASRSTSLFIEQTPFGAAFSGAFQTSPEVLGAIYTDHYRHVLQVCRRFFRQREDAEDVASEVFLKLHRVLDKKDESSPFRPWLSQVAGRHCIDKLRQRKRENTACVAGSELSELPDRSALSPLSQVLRSEQRRQVREELNRLPEHYKVPLVLRYYKRMSYSEIARALNSRLPVVKMIIFRAKCQLRRNLQRSQQSQVPACVSGD